jgi:hypothetical protein
MPDGFIEAVAADNFAAELTNLSLQHETGQILAGNGIVRLDEEGLSFSATTDGSAWLERAMQEIDQQPGQLFPSSFYLQLSGQTHDGWTATAARIPRIGYHISDQAEHATWNIGPGGIHSDITFVRRRRDDEPRRTRLVLSPASLPFWPRQSPYGQGGFTHDRLECQLRFGNLSARRLTETKVVVQVEHAADCPEGLIPAIQSAFSYLMGKITDVIGFETSQGDELRQCLKAVRHRITTNSYAPPLGTDHFMARYYELFLTQAISYFLTDEGRDVSNLLYACWDAADNTFTSRTLIVCAVVESLTEIFRDAVVAPPTLTPEQLGNLRQFAIDAGYPEVFLRRLNGFLGGLDAPSATNILNNWSRTGYCGTTPDDVRAWRDLRNDAAHGQRLWSDDIAENQESIRRRYLVETMINRIVLSAMGYAGPYCDYANNFEFRQLPPLQQP